jgi:predicted SnoaL-like aldol condensation-catalyzing enzyme
VEGNKQIAMRVLKGAFIDRDPSVVDRYFSPTYIQHNPSIPNGPAPIPGLIASLSKDFSYEPGMAVAEGDLVMVHGRYVGWGPKPMIAVDIFRVADGKSPSIGTSCRRKCRRQPRRAATRCSRHRTQSRPPRSRTPNCRLFAISGANLTLGAHRSVGETPGIDPKRLFKIDPTNGPEALGSGLLLKASVAP